MLYDGRIVIEEVGEPVQFWTARDSRYQGQSSTAAILWLRTPAGQGTVVVGGEHVIAAASARRGRTIAPDTEIVMVDVDLREIYADATADGDVVEFAYVSRFPAQGIALIV